MPRGKKKSHNPLIVDLSELADLEAARAEAEGRWRDVNAADLEMLKVHGPEILAGLEAIQKSITDRHLAAVDKARAAVAALSTPLLDTLDAIRRTIEGRLA